MAGPKGKGTLYSLLALFAVAVAGGAYWLSGSSEGSSKPPDEGDIEYKDGTGAVVYDEQAGTSEGSSWTGYAWDVAAVAWWLL